jgi:hypothetical protein
MKSQVQSAAALLLLAFSFAAVAQESEVDPDLTNVATAGPFRALVYSRCSPEHCWSELSIEVLSLDGVPRSIVCKAEVAELSTGHIITALDWAWPIDNSSGGATLDVSVEPSHGGFEPYVARLIVRGDCSYEIEPPRAAV